MVSFRYIVFFHFIPFGSFAIHLIKRTKSDFIVEKEFTPLQNQIISFSVFGWIFRELCRENGKCQQCLIITIWDYTSQRPTCSIGVYRGLVVTIISAILTSKCIKISNDPSQLC